MDEYDLFIERDGYKIYKKICAGCGLLLPLSNFSKRKNKYSKFRSRCVICFRLYSRNYRANNIDSVKETRKVLYIKHKDKQLAASKKYQNINREKVRAKQKEWAQNNKDKNNSLRRQKYKNNANYKLRSVISASINTMLKKKALNKQGRSITNFLSYSIQELKLHIENQFEPWMSWSNWGKYSISSWNDNDQLTWTWQIDHIVPQCCFFFTSVEDDGFKQCWALKNLRPYSAKQNILDNNRMNKNVR